VSPSARQGNVAQRVVPDSERLQSVDRETTRQDSLVRSAFATLGVLCSKSLSTWPNRSLRNRSSGADGLLNATQWVPLTNRQKPILLAKHQNKPSLDSVEACCTRRSQANPATNRSTPGLLLPPSNPNGRAKFADRDFRDESVSPDGNGFLRDHISANEAAGVAFR